MGTTVGYCVNVDAAEKLLVSKTTLPPADVLTVIYGLSAVNVISPLSLNKSNVAPPGVSLIVKVVELATVLT